MKYLLASDFDGTLLRQKQVSEEDRAAIAAWQKAGHIFCLCSGRAPQAATEEMRKWGLHPDLLITGNGSSAIDMDGRFRFRHLFPEYRIIPMLDRACELNCTGFHLHGKNGELLIWDSTHPTRTNITREQAEQYSGASQFGAIFKGSVDVATLYTEWVNTTLDDVTAHANGAHIDCTVRGVDKATGVAEAAKLFGIDLKNCHTVGDNKNDLPMLLPYHGAAIETGNPETIEKVGKSTPSVAAFIQEILQ